MERDAMDECPVCKCGLEKPRYTNCGFCGDERFVHRAADFVEAIRAASGSPNLTARQCLEWIASSEVCHAA
jgi:hypothetical protein